MPFLEAARHAAHANRTSGELRAVLEFMLRRAVGRANAVPLEEIVGHLNAEGFPITPTGFQQTVLKSTREGEIFIGSSNRGYFLIENIDDAREMQRFYVNRIAAEQAHLENLLLQTRHQGWQL
jgi:hypothetical protein